ncbi:hypothetical protein G6M26_21070 [Agrobacterium tumefaciens]|nr:hypothetical protein [Agrobacterium tumefaciens]NTE21031.1 hypothetical protein [Agrobacterium tumefaciens]
MTGKQLAEKENSHKLPVSHHIELIFGAWKDGFAPDEIKNIMAETLNKWTVVHQKYLDLNGYLITDRSLFLIVAVHQVSFDELLFSFYAGVSKAIKKQHHMVRAIYNEEEEGDNSKRLYLQPFEKRVFYDDHLIALLTGEKVSSVYYDPSLERLKQNIHHYTYCSAIDYAGGVGPVRVKRIHKINL